MPSLNINVSAKDKKSSVIVFIIFFLFLSVGICFIEKMNADLSNKVDFIKNNAIEVTFENINRANDGKLIATSGNVYTDNLLEDKFNLQNPLQASKVFGEINVSQKNALVLKRKVEMYQWVETKSETRDSSGHTRTNYSYSKKWDEKRHKSANFHNKRGHENPRFVEQSKKIYSQNATMGEFKITQTQLSMMGDFRTMYELPQVDGYEYYDKAYYTNDPYSPQIGDIRISYHYVSSGTTISLVGKQNIDNTISKAQNKNKEIYIQYDGVQNLKQMLKKDSLVAIILTSLFRIFLTFFLFIILVDHSLMYLFRRFLPLPILDDIIKYYSPKISLLIALTYSLTLITVCHLLWLPSTLIYWFLAVILSAVLLKMSINKNKQNAVKTVTKKIHTRRRIRNDQAI